MLFVTHSFFSTACTSPMVYFNCSSAKPSEKGSECQKSCQAAEAECVRNAFLFTTTSAAVHIVNFHTKAAEQYPEDFGFVLNRLVNSVYQAVCVQMACCLMITVAVLRKRTVPVHIMEKPMELERLSLWTATPGGLFATFPPTTLPYRLTVEFLNGNVKFIISSSFKS